MDDAIPLSITLEDAHKLLLYAKDVSLLANTLEDAQELIHVSLKTVSCVLSQLSVTLKHRITSQWDTTLERVVEYLIVIKNNHINFMGSKNVKKTCNNMFGLGDFFQPVDYYKLGTQAKCAKTNASTISLFTANFLKQAKTIIKLYNIKISNSRLEQQFQCIPIRTETPNGFWIEIFLQIIIKTNQQSMTTQLM